MRILFQSNSPLVQSGYGSQTRLFVPRIRALGHDIAVFAFYGNEGSILEWDGIKIYPKHVAAFGQDIGGAHAKHFRADLIITLIDAWVTAPEATQGVPMACWAPIDHDPAPPGVVNKLKQCFQSIAYSRFGVEQMTNAGLDPRYVPHGVDTKIFAPMDRAGARQKLGWPSDRYIVGLVAANKGHSPVRKCFPEQIEAFAHFKKKHPDALLYIHSNVAEPAEWQPVNIPAVMEQFGLREGHDVAWPSQYEYYVGGISDQQMAVLYNSFDVLLHVSRGEGFGLCQLEAEACGTPVICGGWTSMPELNFGGWVIPKTEAHRDWTMQGSWMFIPRPAAIADRLEQAFKQSGSEKRRTQAREGAMQYDADLVTKQYWAPVLAELEERLSAPRLVAGPLRRAA